MCIQLGLEVICKRPKKEEGIPSNFYEFGSEKFHCKNYPKIKDFDVWMLQSCGLHGMNGCDFLKLMSNKVIQRL